MLDAYIIEEIKKRDQDRRRQEDASRPRLEIEIDPRRPPPRDDRKRPDDGEPEEEPREDEDDESDAIRIHLRGR